MDTRPLRTSAQSSPGGQLEGRAALTAQAAPVSAAAAAASAQAAQGASGVCVSMPSGPDRSGPADGKAAPQALETRSDDSQSSHVSHVHKKSRTRANATPQIPSTMDTHPPRTSVQSSPPPPPPPPSTAGASTAGASRLRVAVPPRPGAYKMLEAGRGKKFWQGCRTAERPHDAFKRYGFHKAVFQIIGGLLQDNGVQMTPQLQTFVDSRSGTVRVSDCADFPGQQAKYVLIDVLLGAGIVDVKNNLPVFIKRHIENTRHASGSLLYPSLAYVPSGHSSVSFPNLHGISFFLKSQDFACLWYQNSVIQCMTGINPYKKKQKSKRVPTHEQQKF